MEVDCRKIKKQKNGKMCCGQGALEASKTGRCNRFLGSMREFSGDVGITGEGGMQEYGNLVDDEEFEREEFFIALDSK